MLSRGSQVAGQGPKGRQLWGSWQEESIQANTERDRHSHLGALNIHRLSGLARALEIIESNTASAENMKTQSREVAQGHTAAELKLTADLVPPCPALLLLHQNQPPLAQSLLTGPNSISHYYSLPHVTPGGHELKVRRPHPP